MSLQPPGLISQKPLVGRAAATADYDNDGDPDIVIMNSNQRAVLLRNDGGNRKNYLSIKLVGTQSNRDGIGAKVTVTTGDMTQIREVKSGSSYASGSDTRLLFGLGENQGVEKVSIVWQSGYHPRIARHLYQPDLDDCRIGRVGQFQNPPTSCRSKLQLAICQTTKNPHPDLDTGFSLTIEITVA